MVAQSQTFTPIGAGSDPLNPFIIIEIPLHGFANTGLKRFFGFPAELAFNKRLKQNAFEAGLICYPMGGTIDGKQGDHVLLAPPFIIDTGHIDEIVSKLDTAIKATLQSL